MPAQPASEGPRPRAACEHGRVVNRRNPDGGATLELRPLDQQRDRLPAAEAQGRDAALGLAFRHRVEQRDEDARADAPIGWPSAIPPPRTFTRSLEIPASLVHAAVTTADASLIS
jgi:hypothetical protein